MNICIVTPIFPPEIGGPATYSYEIAELLRDRGHKIRIVTFTDNVQRLDGVEISTVEKEFGTLLIRQTNLFSSVLKSARGCDLIYAQDPAVVGLASSLAGKVLRKPIMLKFVGDIAWETAFQQGETSKFLEEFLKAPEGGASIRGLLMIQRFVLENAEKVVVPSDYLKRILMENYKLSHVKVKVIPNSIHLENYQDTSSPESIHPKIVTAGRLMPWKGMDEVIRAASSLTEDFPNLKLTILGEGPERKILQELVKKLDIGKTVTLKGPVEHTDLMELLKGSDIFVLNSRYEGLPHIILEAMASRSAVVASDIDANKELVKDKKTGLTVETGDERGLQERLELLLRNSALREKLVKNAFQLVKDKFTWDENIQDLEETMRKVSE